MSVKGQEFAKAKAARARRAELERGVNLFIAGLEEALRRFQGDPEGARPFLDDLKRRTMAILFPAPKSEKVKKVERQRRPA